MKKIATTPSTPMETLIEAAAFTGDSRFHAAPRNMPAQLLAYLRDRFEDDRIGYASAPTRMRGGADAFTYRFRLSHAPPQLDPSLVLRLYPKGKAASRATKESAVQNALARQGYPASPVYATCTDISVLDSAFLVMRLLPGRPMLSSALETIPVMLGRAHAALHEIDPVPVVESLRSQGLEPVRYRFADELGALHKKIAAAHERFAPLAGWLSANRPPEPVRLSVCHGDFHPMNILVRDGETTGVLDWSDSVVADPALDVASTLLLIRLASRHLLSLPNIDRRIERYLAAYCAVRSLCPDRLEYYQVMRCALLLTGAVAHSPIWSRPQIVGDATAVIRRATGIAIPDE